MAFGGLALPNGQGTQSYINLNDAVNWYWMGWLGGADSDYPLHSVGRYLWRSKGTFLGQDAGSRKLTFPMNYRELNNPLGTALAKLSQAGQQNLTFDNLTATPVKFSAAKSRRIKIPYSPYWWTLDLEFIAPTPWFSDLSASTVGATALNSGSVTNFNVTYAGSVFAEPVWTLTIPAGNAAPISSFALSNLTAGESLTLVFPGNLAASTAYTLTIDCAAMTVVDQNSVSYDATGSFPNLYGPAGQVNSMRGTLTPASGTATGCTIAGSYNNRWEV